MKASSCVSLVLGPLLPSKDPESLYLKWNFESVFISGCWRHSRC
uniref:Uncharacterized protein n=1 Tax=Rhizophora mucronata TaxID=61149 RepID=A0A2P2KE66_RHIMU